MFECMILRIDPHDPACAILPPSRLSFGGARAPVMPHAVVASVWN